MKNYFKILLQGINNHPLFTLINISGLVIGLICLILTSLWVTRELGYDGFQEKKDQIYKISQGKNFSTVPPLFGYIKDEFPEIKKIIRTTNDAVAYINSEDNKRSVKINNGLYTTPDFDDIFTCKTISGNIESALNDPDGIILTRKLALSIFGKTDVEGNVIHYTATFPVRELTLTVRAVMDEFPSNSTLKFDALIPFKALNRVQPNGMKPDENWRDGYCNIYVLLEKGTNPQLLTNKLEKFGSNLEQIVYNIDPNSSHAKERRLGLVNLKELHFFNNNKKQLIGYISLIGFLIILIAIINYINLSIAKLFSTFQSLLIRKINGASRYRLILNILTESVLYSIIAFCIALFLVGISKPLLSRLFGYDFSLNYLDHPGTILLLFFSALFVGIIAGLYPALKVTSNIPVNIARTNFIKKDKHFIRQSLVIFQLIISTALIISAIVISKQINFISKKNLGFDNKQIIYAHLNKNLYRPYNTFKEKLLKNPNIKSISGSQNELGQVCVTLTRDINGTRRYFQELPADPDFIKTMGLKLIKGRNFSWDLPTDRFQTLILNETAIKDFELNPDSIIGTEVYMYDRKARVIGVVEDFYFQSFHHKLDPFMLYYHPNSLGMLNIKISGNNIPETIKYIRKVWKEFSPDIPFEYHFLDKTYEDLYRQDTQFSEIITLFLFVAIFISCLGLFGLVSFTTMNRTKEIAIRKINGASVSEIIKLLSKDFIKWAVIAFLIACPIAYYAMHRWLQSFAYKIELRWWFFALAGIIVFMIALVTVSWQTFKAARRNPIESLRYE